MSLLKRDGESIEYLCPGCMATPHYYQKGHRINLETWKQTGTDDCPTFTPSILARTGSREQPDKLVYTCHHFIKDGKIEYLSDCTHSLAGKTVDMAHYDEVQ